MRKSTKLILAMAMVCFAIMAINANCVLADDAVELETLKKVKSIKKILNKKVLPALTEADVPRTGQTTSYATGDDGDLQKGKPWPNPRFTDNGDGTVTDNLTGLMWTTDANLYGAKVWSDALTDCDNCTVGGYTDWNLPQLKELQSLIHFGFFGPALPNAAGTGPWTSGDPFTNVQMEFYWSSTTDADEDENAWYVWLTHGITFYTWKGDAHHVWCVRGPN